MVINRDVCVCAKAGALMSIFPLTVCSVEQEPTPELSNCEPITDDLLALSDGLVKKYISH